MHYQTLVGYNGCAMADAQVVKLARGRRLATRPRSDHGARSVQGSLVPLPRPGTLHPHNESSPATLDGRLCGLLAVDIAGFNDSRRDDDIQIYIHTSLYEMMQEAFNRSGLPWSGCTREDRGDGVLVVIPPSIPVDGLAGPIPDRLHSLVRRHNWATREAAHIQLRVAIHLGPVHYDGHGFVGSTVNLLYRLLDAPSFKRMLSRSGAEVALIASAYMYENLIRRRPSLADPALFQRLAVRQKETRTSAWAYIPGALPVCSPIICPLRDTPESGQVSDPDVALARTDEPALRPAAERARDGCAAGARQVASSSCDSGTVT